MLIFVIYNVSVEIDGFSTADIPSYLAPSILWSSSSPDVAIRGGNKTLKCIFAGL